MSKSMGTKMLLLWHWALTDQRNSLNEDVWSVPDGLILHLAMSWHSQGSKEPRTLTMLPWSNAFYEETHVTKSINKNIPKWNAPAASSPNLQTVICAKEWQLHIKASFVQRTLIHYSSQNSLLPWWFKVLDGIWMDCHALKRCLCILRLLKASVAEYMDPMLPGIALLTVQLINTEYGCAN